MAKEYKVMMKTRGKWYDAHVNGFRVKITRTHAEAVKVMERTAKQRFERGCPADEYKIVSREVTDWTDD